jgi:SAM-dependent methyltransferase
VGSLKSAERIVPLLINLIKPKSVIDIGCGIGSWLSVFKKLGIEDIFGVDGDWVKKEMLLIPPEKSLALDLKKTFCLERQFDLAISLEVAEHLPPSAAPLFVKSLTSAAPVIFFSAAIPFQGGVNHLNEQWPDYWEQYFREQGYMVIDCIRKRIWKNNDIDYFYAQNSLVFAKPELFDNNPMLKIEYEKTNPEMLSLVHPRRYLSIYMDPKTYGLRNLLLAIALMIKNSINIRIKKYF